MSEHFWIWSDILSGQLWTVISGSGMPHNKFWLVCSNHSWDMGGQTFIFFFFFRGLGELRLFLSYTCKNHCNFLMCSPIALKFGTDKEHIKVNSGTEFGMNLIGNQCVRSDDLHRKWLNFRHVYRTNHRWK